MLLNAKMPPHWRSLSIWLLYIAGFFPAAWSFYLGMTDALGADPVKAFEHSLGLWSLRFLVLTLAVSPLRNLGGPNLIRYRRALGLLCFYYVMMHFTFYAVVDQALVLSAILDDVLTRPFLMLGMAALLMLVPLAATSNSFSIKHLGANWSRLHKLIYVIAISAALHYALSTKIWMAEHYFYLSLIAVLLGFRVVWYMERRGRRRIGRPVASH